MAREVFVAGSGPATGKSAIARERKPVNDLSRGATVHDIVNPVAITATQAQEDSA